MSIRVAMVLICLSAWLALPVAHAQTYDRTQIQLIHGASRQPNDLARYLYLTRQLPRLGAADQSLALQLKASAANELGLYDQAIFGFPLKPSDPPDLSLPTSADWQAEPAVDVIARLAAHRRIVMVNEAHHYAHTRVLTLALLPRLRALGFNYFAAEALTGDAKGMMKRGYALQSDGTEYLHEPLYGDIIREAIRLGFTIVAYDADGNPAARETRQADNLYRQVFARDPNARLFVHAGYAHIDKAAGRLGRTPPMAMQLAKLTGIEPLSVDQTQFLETRLDKTDNYHQLIARFHPTGRVVLVRRTGDQVWSAQPKLYDANVILPPSLNMKAFGDEGMYGTRLDPKTLYIDDSIRFSPTTPTLNEMSRPAWLSRGGKRLPYAISATLCRNNVPCVVEAHFINEPDDAVAADRYVFLKAHSSSRLYLSPGRYRLRAWNENGKTLSERIVQISNR